MKLKLLFFIFLFAAVGINAQEFMFGNITTEDGVNLPNVIVYNTRTDEKTVSSMNGTFMISAKIGDRLRFFKSGYQRVEQQVYVADFTRPLNIYLIQAAELIPEVELVFVPTGDIKKDTKMLNPPQKVVALNNEVNNWMRKGQKEMYPRNTAPSSFSSPNYNAGQVNIISMIGAIAGLAKKVVDPKSTPNYAETEKFYQRVRSSVDLQYFKNYGLTDYEIDKFFAYAEDNLSLSKNYRTSFNVAKIELELRLLLKDYVNKMKEVS